MVQVKGVHISSTLKFNKAALGEERYNTLISKMSPEDQKVVTKTILDTTFYSLDILVHYLEILTKDVLGGNEDILRKATAAVIAEQFNGVYKAFLMLGSPDALIEKIYMIGERHYQGLTVEKEYLDKKKIKIRFLGFEKSHRIYEVPILAWFDKALELLGGKNIKVELFTSLAENKGCLELVASWE